MCMVTSEHQRVEDLPPDASCVCELDRIANFLDCDLHESSGGRRHLVESCYGIVNFFLWNII